jgi:predicted HTH transcriptional regulator
VNIICARNDDTAITHPSLTVTTTVASTKAFSIRRLQKKSRINQRELSDQLETSLSTIKHVMTGMIQTNVLTRKGGKRYGYWEIEAKE